MPSFRVEDTMAPVSPGAGGGGAKTAHSVWEPCSPPTRRQPSQGMQEKGLGSRAIVKEEQEIAR